MSDLLENVVPRLLHIPLDDFVFLSAFLSDVWGVCVYALH